MVFRLGPAEFIIWNKIDAALRPSGTIGAVERGGAKRGK